MSWSLVTTGAGGATGSATSIAVATAGAIQVGDVIIVAQQNGSLSANQNTTTLADSLGNTYTKLGEAFDAPDNQDTYMWYSIATHAGTPTITATLAASDGFREIVIAVFRSSLGTPTFDGSSTAQLQTVGSGSGNATTNSATPTADGDLAVAVFENTNNGTATFTAGTGYTVAKQDSSNSTYTAIEYKALGSGTSGVAQTATGTDSLSGSKVFNQLALFKEPAGAGPTNTVAPAVTGTATVEQTLSCSQGTWTGSPTSYAYQWQRDNSGGGTFSNIGGATSSTYTLVSADVGNAIRCVVTATNGSGNTSANSNSTARVSAIAATASGATVTGTALVGATLAASVTVGGDPTPTTTWQWQTDGGTGTWTNIVGATSATYVPVVGDVGHNLRFIATATNASAFGGGSASATSGQVGPVVSVLTAWNEFAWA